MANKKRRKSSGSSNPSSACTLSPNPPKIINQLNRPCRRFYEPLTLLYTLEPNRGKHKYHGITRLKHLDYDNESNVYKYEGSMREFLNAVAYACDYCKGGKSTAAAALMESSDPAIPILVVAGNDGVSNQSEAALRGIFEELARLTRNKELEQEVRANVLQKMIDAGLPRLKEYRKQLRNQLQALQKKEVLMKNLKGVSRNMVKLLHEEISRPDSDFHITVERSHMFVKSGDIGTLRQDIDSRVDKKDIELGSNIHHYAGRVGALFSYSKALVRAAQFPQNANLFENLEIISLPAPDVSWYPIFDTKIPDGNGIIGRMTSDTARQLELKELYAGITTILRDLNIPDGLESNLMSFSKNGRRVHAELQLVEFFRTPRSDFEKPQFWIQQDPFIGCSKPACYLCDLYVKAIPDKFELYGTHQKIYIAWRAPDIRPNPSQDDINAMKDIFNKMVGPVRKEVEDVLRKKHPKRMKQMDSSIGISDVPRTAETITSDVSHTTNFGHALSSSSNVSTISSSSTSSIFRQKHIVSATSANFMSPLSQQIIFGDSDDDTNDASHVKPIVSRAGNAIVADLGVFPVVEGFQRMALGAGREDALVGMSEIHHHTSVGDDSESEDGDGGVKL